MRTTPVGRPRISLIGGPVARVKAAPGTRLAQAADGALQPARRGTQVDTPPPAVLVRQGQLLRRRHEALCARRQAARREA